MGYKVIISDKANSLIKQHLLFIANVSKDASKKQNREFKDSIKMIAEDPKAYPFFEGDFIPFGKYRKYVISKRYIIIYQVIEETVYIEYIVDTRTDYSFLVK